MRKIKEFIMREIMDEYVLIPTGSTTETFNGMITLSETGAFIYKHIEECTCFEDLIIKMKEEYDAPEEVLRKDALEFLNHMLYEELIAICDMDKGW